MPAQPVDSVTEKAFFVRARQDLAFVQVALPGQSKAYEALWQYYR